MGQSGNNTPKAVQDCHELLLWLIPLLDNFPRNRRFTLGERIESGLLDVLALLVDAAWSKDKRAVLTDANRKLEIVRHLWRLCFELQVIPSKRFAYGAERIDELGRQVGGWARASR